jgi:hypothetical protein
MQRLRQLGVCLIPREENEGVRAASRSTQFTGPGSLQFSKTDGATLRGVRCDRKTTVGVCDQCCSFFWSTRPCGRTAELCRCVIGFPHYQVRYEESATSKWK